MITVTWMPNEGRDVLVLGREYLECRNEEVGNEPRENRVDIVKVYFCGGTDIVFAKREGLEMAVARQIFSNREKYGKVLTAQFEKFPTAIYFFTATSALLGGKE